MITVENATDKDLRYFADHIREEDKKEYQILSGHDCLYEDLRRLVCVKTIWWNNSEILGVGGIVGNEAVKMASPWLFLTDAVLDHKIEFLRWSKKYRDEMLSRYEQLENCVYKGNQLHIDYLTWLGAVWWDKSGDIWYFYISK